MTDIDDRMSEHYHRQSLPDNVIGRMVDYAHDVDPPLSFAERSLNVLKNNALRFGVAAALLFAVAGMVHNNGVHAERTDRAIKEVAMNHSTRFDLEFENDSVAGIDSQMALLPFDLVLPEPIGQQYEVKGARYCSLSGQLAAHVKLVHRSSDKSLSVFMTRAADELKVIDNSLENVDGVDVKIWRESGLLYAMVGSYEAQD